MKRFEVVALDELDAVHGGISGATRPLKRWQEEVQGDWWPWDRGYGVPFDEFFGQSAPPTLPPHMTPNDFQQLDRSEGQPPIDFSNDGWWR